MALIRSKIFHMLLGLAVSALLLGWIIASSNWREVERQILAMNFWILLPATIVLVAHMLLRAIRWRYLLPKAEDQPLSRLFNALMIGNFATYVLPLRAGELVRPFVLSRQSNITFSTAFASVVIERFFDLAFVLLTFSVVVYFIEDIPSWAHTGAHLLLMMALLIFAFIFFASFLPGISKKIILFCLTPFPDFLKQKVRGILFDFLRAASVTARFSNLVRIVLYTAVVWGSCYFLFYVFLYLLDIEATLLMGTTIAVILALAMAAPSAPGFIGVYQTGCVAGFALFGVDHDMAVAYSLVTHMHHFALFILYGLFLLARYKLSIREISHAAEEAG